MVTPKSDGSAVAANVLSASAPLPSALLSSSPDACNGVPSKVSGFSPSEALSSSIFAEVASWLIAAYSVSMAVVVANVAEATVCCGDGVATLLSFFAESDLFLLLSSLLAAFEPTSAFLGAAACSVVLDAVFFSALCLGSTVFEAPAGKLIDKVSFCGG